MAARRSSSSGVVKIISVDSAGAIDDAPFSGCVTKIAAFGGDGSGETRGTGAHDD
jgi:hypothetical protein